MWYNSEVKALITIWSDDKIQEQLDGVVRNKAVFEKNADKMAEVGYTRDWFQCRQKIKNLKNEYKKIKDNNKQTNRKGAQRMEAF